MARGKGGVFPGAEGEGLKEEQSGCNAGYSFREREEEDKQQEGKEETVFPQGIQV